MQLCHFNRKKSPIARDYVEITEKCKTLQPDSNSASYIASPTGDILNSFQQDSIWWK